MSSRSGRLCACMLFNSDAFIFVYLPIVLAGFYAVVRMRAGVLAQVWLVAASLYFYAYWNVSFLPLLLASIAFNYLAGRVIARLRVTHQSLRTPALIGAVSCNLILLGYFKYAAFLQNTVAHLLSLPSLAENVPIPLGISFFTFTQIAYLVDVTYVDDAERSPISYALFVNFFPHLIAGPILHHRATIPQFVFSFQLKRAVENIAVGVTIFSFGLFKKVVLADGVAPYVLLAFSDKTHPQMCDAWTGVLAYTLQIYFDFSGYSDMAIGLARMFGVVFPLNFNSPYKATSIIDFWRRWHMTLSRFLRDYLYFPLGGNRSGGGQTVNIMITMLLGGLWHGAGLTFVIWGGLHGLYLLINHQWRQRRRQRSASVYHAALSGGLTFLSVVVAWVFFRASGYRPGVHHNLGYAWSSRTGLQWRAHMHSGRAGYLCPGSPHCMLLDRSIARDRLFCAQFSTGYVALEAGARRHAVRTKAFQVALFRANDPMGHRRWPIVCDCCCAAK